MLLIKITNATNQYCFLILLILLLNTTNIFICIYMYTTYTIEPNKYNKKINNATYTIYTICICM